MKAELLHAASKVIPNPQVLVNVVSRRVRQLSLGHRPMVEVPPGMLAADIALSEIIADMLSYEAASEGEGAAATLVSFPGAPKSIKKAA